MKPGMRWSAQHAISACAASCFILGATTLSISAQGSDKSLMQREVNRRAENLVLAKQLLESGDIHYNNKDYKKAVADYSQAFKLVPNAGLTQDVRFVTADRYAVASVEYAKGLAKVGKYDEAKNVLNNVLDHDVSPGHVGAMTLLAQIDDPIKYNQALTPEHVQNIEKVAHWLRKAEGYFMLAQFDEALVAYEEVLRIDKYNVAARRGMERVAQSMRGYQAAATDYSRVERLKEVDAAWEIRPDTVSDSLGGATTAGSNGEGLVQEISGSKIKQMLVPSVDFQDVSIEEALDTLRLWSREFDTTELDPTKKGFNFVMRVGDVGSDVHNNIMSKRISLQLKNVPMSEVLDYVTKATHTQWRIEDYAIVVTPSGMQDTRLLQRTFTVPPGFMQDTVASVEASSGSNPFEDSSNDSVLQPRLEIDEYLKRIGVTFPEGATANYIRGAGKLSVLNTETNLNIIEDYLRLIRKQESVQVVVNFTIIDISQTNLEELGFDWLLGQNNISGGNLFLGGGSPGNGQQIDPVGSLPTEVDPVTSGNRTGDAMFSNNAIDSLIQGQRDFGQSSTPSPGVLQVTGQINNSVFQSIMRGLDQKKDDSKVFTPSLVVRSGERARLYSGNEMMYPTEYEPPELPNNVGNRVGGSAFPVTPSTPTAFETRELGFVFEIEPTISEDRNYIELRLNPTYSQFDGFIDYGSPINSITTDPLTGFPITTPITRNSILQPVFSTIRLNTSVTLADGATMVVGGLHQARIEKVDDKVPVLGDLPFVGRFFHSEGYKPSKRAMIMFVNAKLVDPTGKALTDR